ncbi:cobalamin biosynthesis protein [Microlunatus parietis]|uniref:Adenosylcobinamide-phosphate synthase n=1 Tax=Microlunatus parietis TaxID=682979 RepID=A0A7Y9LD34_9ACTN|nr:cobalamin biosynthesis protein [Microlunatus parietis]NYE72478.1 adenosylcobinamide-phosphate synthase [Microlunatus parietis]
MSATSQLSRVAGLALGYLAGRMIEQPLRRKPVEGFERVSTAIEDRTYADDANWGTVHTATVVGGIAVAGLAVERLTRNVPVLHALATAAATAVVLEGGPDDEPRPARAVIGPLIWGAAFGIPGLLGYRAAHVVADQIGTGDEKYASFGRSAILLRDLLDWLPNQLTEIVEDSAANSRPNPPR